MIFNHRENILTVRKYQPRGSRSRNKAESGNKGSWCSFSVTLSLWLPWVNWWDSGVWSCRVAAIKVKEMNKVLE